MSLDDLWEKFKSALFNAAKEACGCIMKTNRKKQTHWWNDEIKSEVKEKKKLWKQYFGNAKTEIFNENKKVKMLVRKAKGEEFGNQLEESGKADKKLLKFSSVATNKNRNRVNCSKKH